MQSCTVHQQPSVRTPGNSARPLRRCGRKPFQATTARQPCRASLRQEASDAALDTEDRSNAQSTSTSRRSLLHLASVAALSLALPQVQQLTVHTPAAWAAEPASLRPLSKAEQDVVAKAMKAAIPKAKVGPCTLAQTATQQHTSTPVCAHLRRRHARPAPKMIQRAAAVQVKQAGECSRWQRRSVQCPSSITDTSIVQCSDVPAGASGPKTSVPRCGYLQQRNG